MSDIMDSYVLSHLCFCSLLSSRVRDMILLSGTAFHLRQAYTLTGYSLIAPGRENPIPDFLCQELSDYIQSRYMLDADERLFPITKSYLSHEMIRGCKNTGVKEHTNP